MLALDSQHLEMERRRNELLEAQNRQLTRLVNAAVRRLQRRSPTP